MMSVRDKGNCKNSRQVEKKERELPSLYNQEQIFGPSLNIFQRALLRKPTACRAEDSPDLFSDNPKIDLCIRIVGYVCSIGISTDTFDA